MNFLNFSLAGALLFFAFSYHLNLDKSIGIAKPPLETMTCITDLGDDMELQLGDSVQLTPAFSCPLDMIETIFWEPADFLSCTDCLEPVTRPLENICYTMTVNWDDGCISTEEICIQLRSCEALYTENNINSISPEQIGDEAEIELEISRTQFAHIEIVENDEVQYTIWEGWLKSGLRTLTLDFSAVPTGSHQLRVRLYPEDQIIDIEKL